MASTVRAFDVQQLAARGARIDAPVAPAPEEGNPALVQDLWHLRVEPGTVAGVEDAALRPQTAAEPPLAFRELPDVGLPFIEVGVTGRQGGADVQPPLADEAFHRLLQLRALMQQVFEPVEEFHVIGVVVVLRDQLDGVAQRPERLPVFGKTGKIAETEMGGRHQVVFEVGDRPGLELGRSQNPFPGKQPDRGLDGAGDVLHHRQERQFAGVPQGLGRAVQGCASRRRLQIQGGRERRPRIFDHHLDPAMGVRQVRTRAAHHRQRIHSQDLPLFHVALRIYFPKLGRDGSDSSLSTSGLRRNYVRL